MSGKKGNNEEKGNNSKDFGVVDEVPEVNDAEEVENDDTVEDDEVAFDDSTSGDEDENLGDDEENEDELDADDDTVVNANNFFKTKKKNIKKEKNPEKFFKKQVEIKKENLVLWGDLISKVEEDYQPDDVDLIYLVMWLYQIIYTDLDKYLNTDTVNEVFNILLIKSCEYFEMEVVDNIIDKASLIYLAFGKEGHVFNVLDLEFGSMDEDDIMSEFQPVSFRKKLFDHFLNFLYSNGNFYSNVLNAFRKVNSILYQKLAVYLPSYVLDSVYNDLIAIFYNDEEIVFETEEGEVYPLIELYISLLFRKDRTDVLLNQLGLERVDDLRIVSKVFSFAFTKEDDANLKLLSSLIENKNDLHDVVEYANIFASTFENFQMSRGKNIGSDKFDAYFFESAENMTDHLFATNKNLESIKEFAFLILITFWDFGDELAAYFLDPKTPYTRFD